MADVFPIRTFYACLIFPAGYATSITDDQVIDNLDKLKLFQDNDCKIYASLFVAQTAKILVKGGWTYLTQEFLFHSMLL